jgi:DNA-binding XRE family transcriptional regulator
MTQRPAHSEARPMEFADSGTDPPWSLVDFRGGVGEGAPMPPLSPRHRALGDALRTMRRERGLSQEALGSEAGLSANYVGDTERGERNVSVRVLWQLADGLGISAAELLREAKREAAGAKR